ncbi:hypothetical protein AB0B94_30510 [Micromonospora sp. NPDC048986]|uniref:hypothetical protein n=1 Tax=Micromonospora sp. NPDC048986 TaxID=3155644 RepID=UPI00340F9A05
MGAVTRRRALAGFAGLLALPVLAACGPADEEDCDADDLLEGDEDCDLGGGKKSKSKSKSKSKGSGSSRSRR